MILFAVIPPDLMTNKEMVLRTMKELNGEYSGLVSHWYLYRCGDYLRWVKEINEEESVPKKQKEIVNKIHRRR